MTLCRLAPWRHRMTTTRGTAFTTTMRVINRVHDDAANMRATTFPPVPACFAEIDIAVVRV